VIPKQNSPTQQDLTHSKQYSVTDSAGNTIQKTMPITYQEFSTSRSIKIVASIQIVEVETGRYVSGNNFNEDIIDEFKWVKYSGNISDLPKDKQNLVNKRPAYRSNDIMIGDGLNQLSKKMGGTVLAYFK
jgi:hypothetical protein